MAVFETTRPAVAARPASIMRFIGTAVSAFQTWNDTRRTRNSLQSLSARELDDIGLTYGDIDTVARRVSQ